MYKKDIQKPISYIDNHLIFYLNNAIINESRKEPTSAELAPLAQLVEQLTLNQWVQGSSP